MLIVIFGINVIVHCLILTKYVIIRILVAVLQLYWEMSTLRSKCYFFYNTMKVREPVHLITQVIDYILMFDNDVRSWIHMDFIFTCRWEMSCENQCIHTWLYCCKHLTSICCQALTQNMNVKIYYASVVILFRFLTQMKSMHISTLYN